MSPQSELQRLLDDSAQAVVRWCSRGEFHGSVVVRRRVVIEADGSVFVAQSGPAIIVERRGDLELRGGCVTTMDRSGTATHQRVGCAVNARAGATVRFFKTDIIGEVAGVQGLDGPWFLPSVLLLPDILPKSQAEFHVQVELPHRIAVRSAMHGVEVVPASYDAGPVTLRIIVNAADVEHGVALDGELLLEQLGVIRRIRIRSHVARGADAHAPTVVWRMPVPAQPTSPSEDARVQQGFKTAAPLSPIFTRPGSAPRTGTASVNGPFRGSDGEPPADPTPDAPTPESPAKPRQLSELLNPIFRRGQSPPATGNIDSSQSPSSPAAPAAAKDAARPPTQSTPQASSVADAASESAGPADGRPIISPIFRRRSP